MGLFNRRRHNHVAPGAPLGAGLGTGLGGAGVGHHHAGAGVGNQLGAVPARAGGLLRNIVYKIKNVLNRLLHPRRRRVV